MTTTSNNGPIDAGRLETLAHVLFLVGIMAVYQQNAEVLHQIGLALMALGALGSVGSVVLRAAPWQRAAERVMILGMIAGIVGMLQPWNILLYENGFYLVALATLGFIVVSHIPVRD